MIVHAQFKKLEENSKKLLLKCWRRKEKQARVQDKLRFMKSPKGSLMDDYFPIINDSLNIPSSYVEIELHSKNHPPSLLSYGDSYEEDLKFGI